MPPEPNDNSIREGDPPYQPHGSKPAALESAPPNENTLLLLFAAGVVWMGGTIALGDLGGGPTIRAPFPLPWVILAYVGVYPILVALIPAIALLIWQPQLWRRGNVTSSVPFPVHSWGLLAVAMVFSFTCFSGGWGYGVHYQGFVHTRNCALLSAGLAFLSTLLAIMASWTKNVHVNVLAHAALFYWLSSYAFPYLGELL